MRLQAVLIFSLAMVGAGCGKTSSTTKVASVSNATTVASSPNTTDAAAAATTTAAPCTEGPCLETKSASNAALSLVSLNVSTGGVLPSGSLLCSTQMSTSCWNEIQAVTADAAHVVLYKLDMQNDGNLVLYSAADSMPVWASNTSRAVGAYYATMDPKTSYLQLWHKGDAQPYWWSGGAQFSNLSLTVQGDANLVIYNKSAVAWASSTLGWALPGSNNTVIYKNNYLLCTNTPRSPAAASINACIAKTPINWTMLLDAATYTIESQNQIILNKPMTLSTVGGWKNASPCANVPSIGNPAGGEQFTGTPCAQIYAADSSLFGFGGFFIMGNPSSKKVDDGSGYMLPQFTQISNVNVDHINLNGNYVNRYKVAVGTGQANQIQEFANALAANCDHCSFTNSVSSSSITNGFGMYGDTHNFKADHNSYYNHGNLFEPSTPRHAACAVIQGANSLFTNNFVRDCTDEAVIVIDAAFSKIDTNSFIARDGQLSSTMLRVFTDSHNQGIEFAYNDVDCTGAQCDVGVTIGANQYAGAMDGSGYLYAGQGATNGILIHDNIITGANIGIMVGFRPIVNPQTNQNPGIYIYSNTITAANFGKDFSPMACRQWANRTIPQGTGYVCCQPQWYNVKMANWPGSYKNMTMAASNSKGPIHSTTIMVDPNNFDYVFKDFSNTKLVANSDAASASWIGAGGFGDDSASCF